MVTIYDVAKNVGCSPATVSKAFNNYSGVNPTTRQKIMDASAKLGYIPNNNARALATKKTWLIGVIFADDIGVGIMHPHYSEILENFKKTVNMYGYDVLFINKEFGNISETYLEHCRFRGVDGLLLALGSNNTDEIKDILSSEIKCVSIEMIYPNKNSIICDNRMGTMQALEYLYFLGHRKIAHISCPLDSIAGIERARAYKDFLREKGIEENPKYFVETKEFLSEAGNQAAKELLQNCWGDLPTAVFMGWDDIAFAAMNTFQAQGVRIPEDISVVGFDNVKMAGFVTPKLTTIEQDRKTIGEKAGNILINLIENKVVEESDVSRIPTKLIVRNSCARIL